MNLELKENTLSNFEDKICFICGKGESDSVDHIPPKGLFHSKYRNNNLITVPAHSKCNMSFAKDDEYFRDNIVLSACAVNKKAQELFDDKIIRAFQREQADAYRKMHISQLSNVEIRSPSGLFLKDMPIKIVDLKRTDNVIARICRGLYYHRTKNILSLDCEIKVDMLKPEAIEIRNKCKPILQEIVPDIFEFIFIPCKEDKDINTIVLFFYNCFTFYCTTGKLAATQNNKKEKEKSYNKLEGIQFSDDTLWFPPGTNFYS